ncbi:MAG: hypothetical protein JO294_15160, partial [Alphaproteobacteria bacterium]|nr:hypothetical protein [Alphaproteobacteria bacterium]
MATMWNIVICVALLAVFAAGLALFWIARQDDSTAGRNLGLLVMAIAVV